MPQLVDVSTDQQDRGLEASLVIDRDTAVAPRHLGASSSTTPSTTPSASARSPITYTPLNQYHVVMEVAPRYWQDPETLRDLYVRSADGTQVPLSAFSGSRRARRPSRSIIRASSPR